MFDLCHRSALDVCHEAVTIIEQVLDKMDFADKDECYSSIVKDRLAVAYLWQALLEHRFAMEGKQLEESVELSESFDANEVLFYLPYLQKAICYLLFVCAISWEQVKALFFYV